MTHSQFYTDILAGLKQSPKRLDSKYFYDAAGDKLFQEIMNCPEYYLTDCEMEIFTGQTAMLAEILMADGSPFDLIELGAGDATKSSHLLKHLVAQQADFTYLPIDISSNVISYLNATLQVTIPGLQVKGLNGEYFDMLKQAAEQSPRRKVLLFLGSNIGNMPVMIAENFCHSLRKHISPGDMLLVGFDLKKNPKTVLDAYNDKGGITKRFNINLLHRINRELHADIDPNQFDHYATYDPETGSCKSYLISLADQQVNIPGAAPIAFKKDEYIFMEISQKYNPEQIAAFAANTGFRTVRNLFDNKNWFTDAIWMAE